MKLIVSIFIFLFVAVGHANSQEINDQSLLENKSTQWGVGPVYRHWRYFISSDQESLSSTDGSYSFLGVGFFSKFRYQDKHLFSASGEISQSINSSSRNAEKLDSFHYLRKSNLTNAAISASYRYQIIPFLSLGVGATMTIPADLGFMFRQAFFGSMLFDGQLEGEVNLNSQISLLLATGSGGQIMTTDKSFVKDSYSSVALVYWFK